MAHFVVIANKPGENLALSDVSLQSGNSPEFFPPPGCPDCPILKPVKFSAGSTAAIADTEPHVFKFADEVDALEWVGKHKDQLEGSDVYLYENKSVA